MQRPAHTTFRTLLALALVAAVLIVPLGNAWAQEDQNIFTRAAKEAVNEVGISAGGLTASGVFFVIGVVAGFLQQLFTAILYYVAYAMDSAFWGTAVIDPGTMHVVQVGWTTLRDMANAFFILLLLWIALTIIFNLEEWGGKKLLIRIFLVALLINFSLVIVTTVFGFANAIAYVFYQKMDPTREGVGRFIIAKTQLHTVSQVIASGEVENYIQQRTAAKKAEEQQSGAGNTAAGQTNASDRPPLIGTLLAATGVPRADASLLGAGVGGVISCGLGALAGTALAIPSGGASLAVAGYSCAVTGSLATAVTLIWDWAGKSALSSSSRFALYQGAAALLIGLAVFGFLMATIALLVRFLAEIILSVTAPLALISYIMPWGKARGLFDKWLEALFKYAFFAPIFYFLIYMALFMIQQADASMDPKIPILLNADRVLMIIMVVVIMVVATRFARETAGVAGEAAISVGKVAGGALLGWGLGAAGVGVAAASRRLAPGLIKPAIEGLSRTPIIGQLTAPLTRGVTRYLEGQEEEIGKLKDGYKNWNNENLVSEYHRTVGAKPKVAIAQLLAERGRLEELKKSGVKLEDISNMAKGFGEDTRMNIIKYNPSLVQAIQFSSQELEAEKEKARKRGDPEPTNEQAARRHALRRLKPEDIAKMEVRPDEINKELTEDMIAVFGPKHWAKLVQENIGVVNKVMEEIERDGTLTGGMTNEVYRWFTSTTAKFAVGDLPTGHTVPTGWRGPVPGSTPTGTAPAGGPPPAGGTPPSTPPPPGGGAPPPAGPAGTPAGGTPPTTP